jgi:hypothetical protein
MWALGEALGYQGTLDDPENRYKWVVAWVLGSSGLAEPSARNFRSSRIHPTVVPIGAEQRSSYEH